MPRYARIPAATVLASKRETAESTVSRAAAELGLWPPPRIQWWRESAAGAFHSPHPLGGWVETDDPTVVNLNADQSTLHLKYFSAHEVAHCRDMVRGTTGNVRADEKAAEQFAYRMTKVLPPVEHEWQFYRSRK